MRSTCCDAVLLRQVGRNRVAQEIRGHSSKLMTRYYTNTSLEEMLDAVGNVEASDE